MAIITTKSVDDSAEKFKPLENKIHGQMHWRANSHKAH